MTCRSPERQRGRIAPVILVAGLPPQLGVLLGAPLTMLMWVPMLAFEVPGGLWLLVKGAAAL
jgi:hypothetical protein